MMLNDYLLDVKEYILHDFLRIPYPEPNTFPESRLNQDFEIFNTEDGGYIAISKDYQGLHATGRTLEELRTALFDTILVYFDVPRYYAKRMGDSLSLKMPDGTIVKSSKESVVATA